MKQKTFPTVFVVLLFSALIISLFFLPKRSFETKELSVFVNPMIGTGGHGHTFPGATMPFGMVQLSPDTRLKGWDGCSGYHYSDSVIYGFSHTHLSGTGVADYCDILFMPSKQLKRATSEYPYPTRSKFSHTTEIAEPGYYSVVLDDPGIKTEFTVTPRCGIHKYYFSKEDTAFIAINLSHRDKVLESAFRQENETDISGFRISNSWADEQHVYFYARFSQPIKYLDYRGDINADNSEYDAYGKRLFINLGFGDGLDNNLLVKVGISPVSIEGAKKNLEAEAAKYSFKEIREKARSAWNNELSKVLISGGDEESQSIFYTALYHAFLAPNIYSDVDGSYRGTDLNIHEADDTHYTVFSLWDTYRAAHPLYTITQTKRTQEFVRTMLRQYQDGGQLPVWELAANYTGCMIGYHSVPVIVDAWLKGLDDFDKELAMKAMTDIAETKHLGLEPYMKHKYIPVEEEHESVSKALEYAFDDWCIAQAAKEAGKKDIYQTYIQRAQYYKNHLDPETGFMRAKQNGSWLQPFNPREVNFHYTEANAWQYSFYVPQDIDTWMWMLGGRNALNDKLDSLFSADSETAGRNQVDITGLIGQYAHGNEPSHHIAYLYNYAARPWKTQKMLKRIMHEMYRAAPDGLAGNEDCGQMSSWYVMSALGFYPVNPAGGVFEFGSPMFDTACIQLENGKNFRIIAEGLTDENIYIQSIQLNGYNYNKSYIRYEKIMKGGELIFNMGPSPYKSFATRSSDMYSHNIGEHPICINPVFYPNKYSFEDSVQIKISVPDSTAGIYYTTNGACPEKNSKEYLSPIWITDKTSFKAKAFAKGKVPSGTVEARYVKLDTELSIAISSEYDPQYSAGGDRALIDGLRGGDDFRTGAWQGYQGQNLELTVDLGRKRDIKEIGAGFLQDIRSWIWMPKYAIFFISEDGRNFQLVDTVRHKVPVDKYGVVTKDLSIPVNKKARFIKMKADYFGTIPEWHLGKGGEAYIFTDELFFE